MPNTAAALTAIDTSYLKPAEDSYERLPGLDLRESASACRMNLPNKQPLKFGPLTAHPRSHD